MKFEKISLRIIKGLSKMPFPLLYAFSDVAAFFLYHVVRYRRRVVRENLTNCFPQKSRREIKALERKFYLHLCDVVLETLKMSGMSVREREKRFQLVNPGIFQQMKEETGRNTIAVMGHYANWEWLIQISALIPEFKFFTLYQKLENRFINDYVLDTRQCCGMHLIDMRESYRVFARLENNGDYVLSLVADQGPAAHNIRYWVKFLGQDTPVHLGAHQMAVKLKFNVIYLDMERVKRGHYRVTFSPLHRAGEAVEDYRIIDRFFLRLEEQIRRAPAYWLWSHRRWKNKHLKPTGGDA